MCPSSCRDKVVSYYICSRIFANLSSNENPDPHLPTIHSNISQIYFITSAINGNPFEIQSALYALLANGTNTI